MKYCPFRHQGPTGKWTKCGVSGAKCKMRGVWEKFFHGGQERWSELLGQDKRTRPTLSMIWQSEAIYSCCTRPVSPTVNSNVSGKGNTQRRLEESGAHGLYMDTIYSVRGQRETRCIVDGDTLSTKVCVRFRMPALEAPDGAESTLCVAGSAQEVTRRYSFSSPCLVGTEPYSQCSTPIVNPHPHPPQPPTNSHQPSKAAQSRPP